MATVNAGEMAGNFVDVAAFTGQDIEPDNLITIKSGVRYWTSLVDEGSGIVLANNVFANIIT